ncbi:MliC family protein [Bombella apis]|uniref:MliC family protein n=1 Tax=Bombella apis TaxID=1785988 RepID=UPI0012B8A754|nr:MliC family protein [Bombella apis]MPV99607.1 hypothetical protein [Bombella apis]
MAYDRMRVASLCGLLLGVVWTGGHEAVAGDETAASLQAQSVAPVQDRKPGPSPRKKAVPARKAENHLLIPLPADEVVGRQDVDYTCSLDEKKAGDDVRSLRTSLPAGRFTVTYLTADIMALAILPVDGRVLVFSNVVAADGAKYVAGSYSWWSKGDEVTFAREGKDDVFFSCHVVPSGGKTADH